MKVHRENVIAALDLAIERQDKIEKEAYGFVLDSAFLGGIKSLQAALIKGEQIEFF